MSGFGQHLNLHVQPSRKHLRDEGMHSTSLQTVAAQKPDANTVLPHTLRQRESIKEEEVAMQCEQAVD